MPKIIGGSLEEHREQMYSRIFSSFTQLLAEVGYDALTLAEVASRAGIGRTAMYNYFPDKEALLLGYTEQRTDNYLDNLNDELSSVTNPIDQLSTFVRLQMLEIAQQHLALSSMGNMLSDSGRQRMREHVAPLWEILDGILKRAMEQRYLPEGNLSVLLPLVFGTLTGRAVAGLTGDALEHAIDATTEFVLRGLGARLTRDGARRLPAG